MEYILDLIIRFAPLVLAILAFIIGLINVIVRNKGQYTAIKEYILTALPDVIKEVEALNMPGSDKKQVAISSTLIAVQKKYGHLKKKDLYNLTDFTADSIEAILSTPTKKEV